MVKKYFFFIFTILFFGLFETLVRPTLHPNTDISDQKRYRIGKIIGSEKLSDRKNISDRKSYRIGKDIGSKEISDQKIADLPIRYDRKKIGNFRYI